MEVQVLLSAPVSTTYGGGQSRNALVRVKQRIWPMLGFKRFDHAAITISGIELAEKIKKGQFKIGKLRNRPARMWEQWSAALAA